MGIRILSRICIQICQLQQIALFYRMEQGVEYEVEERSPDRC
jgi:hypothetical protein